MMADTLDISSEQVRVYMYAGGKEYGIADPVTLHVTPTGSHRVVDRHGWTHRPEPSWIAIKWKPFPGQPAFVA